jgi:hypothetical protein
VARTVATSASPLTSSLLLSGPVRCSPSELRCWRVERWR